MGTASDHKQTKGVSSSTSTVELAQADRKAALAEMAAAGDYPSADVIVETR